MRQLNFYTKKAIDRYNLNGQNALAREIGIAGATLSQFLNGKALPSEETMVKLAELAGCPKEEALIDLNLWRSKDKPELQKIWQRLSKMIGVLATVAIFSCLNSNTCLAKSQSQDSLNSVRECILCILNGLIKSVNSLKNNIFKILAISSKNNKLAFSTY